MTAVSWKQATAGNLAVSQPSGLSAKAQHMLGRMTVAANIEPTLDSQYVVKGWLDRGAMSIVYGPSNVGKSFFALDIGYHIAAGLDWHGARVCGDPVLYIVAEGGNGFLNRVVALQQREGMPLWCLADSIDLCRTEADAMAVAEVLGHVKQLHGDYQLIVIDTLARAMGAGDEIASQDMGALVRNVDCLRQATGAHVMLIHHTGKDQAKGARGHSSLRASTDTEIELTKNGEVVQAELRKQRDMPCGRPFAYMLREVELGCDSDGDAVTTCVVEPCEPVQRKPVLGSAEQRTMEALHEYAAEYGQPNPAGTDWPEPGTVRVVDYEAFLEFASDRQENSRRCDRRSTAKRAVSTLTSKSLTAMNGGKIWAVH